MNKCFVNSLSSLKNKCCLQNRSLLYSNINGPWIFLLDKRKSIDAFNMTILVNLCNDGSPCRRILITVVSLP